jgi:hypothetical protein
MRVLFLLLAAGLFAAAADPIRLHPANPHYFLFRGKPVVLVTSGEHYGAVLNQDFDYRKYLETLAADGMNYTRIFAGSYVEKPGAFGIKRNTLAPASGRFLPPWARTSTPGYAGGGAKFDLDRWSGEYFTRLKSFVGEAGKRGIVVEVTLFCSSYRDEHWNLNPLNPANNVNGTSAIDWRKLNTLDNGNILQRQEQMVRKIVRELSEFDNVFFEIQNEPWADAPVKVDTINPYMTDPALNRYPNTVELAGDASLAWQRRIASVIVSEEATLRKRSLIAQNYCNFLYAVRDVAPEVSILHFHYAYPEAVTWNYGWNKVIGYDESGFIGNSDSAYRRQGWNFLLAGGGLFNNLDYSFTVGREDGTDTEPNGPGGGSPALRKQLKVLSDFIHSLPFLEMAPDNAVVRKAPGVVTRALSAPGKAYAVYLTGSSPCTLGLDLPKGRYRVEWINTKTGRTDRDETFDHPGGLRELPSPPFEEDVVLRLTPQQKTGTVHAFTNFVLAARLESRSTCWNRRRIKTPASDEAARGCPDRPDSPW